MKQKVSIIGGKYRGKHIAFPDSEGLRPTPSRIRETLFNWLMHSIAGARCLDAFAGSGALGFEASSRGASDVVLVEKSISVYKNLIQIAQTFHDTNIEVIHRDVVDYLQGKMPAFDIIFLDPPFKDNIYTLTIKLIEDGNLLKPNGYLYVESSSPLTLDLDHWTQLKSKQAGNVVYSLYQYK